VAAVLAFLVTLHTESGLGTMLHYLSLIVGSAGIGYAIAKRFGRLWSPWWFVAGGIGLACVWYRFDYYSYHWGEEKNGVELNYYDYRWRSTGKLFYRDFWSRNDDGSYHAEGGFSDSGKQHGPWKSFSSDDYSKTDYEWYWYGEPISEGEWHLRNK